MAIDLKQDLGSLRIDRSQLRNANGGRWSRRTIIIGVIVLAALSGVALASRVFGGRSIEVDVARAQAESSNGAAAVLNATGYIVAHHKINVNSKVTGRIAWIGVEKGDKVKQGQVLVRLEDDEFRAQVEQARGAVLAAEARLKELESGYRPEEVQRSEHELQEARATLANDRANLERARRLAEQGVLSRQDLDNATARFEASQQRVNSLERNYTLFRKGPRTEQIEQARGDLVRARGQLAFAQSQLDATLIRAPVDGTILERTAEKGELVTAQFASGAEGGPRGSVVSLADLNDIQAELDISQNDFARLSSNQKAIITTDAFPDRKYEGYVAEISPEANRQKATVQVKVQVKNPDEYLKPDMNANVQFLAEPKLGEARRSGVFVPSAAVRDREGKKIVWVVADEQARQREVQVADVRAGGFLIEGVKDGETVVVAPPASLTDGARVRVKVK